MISTHCDLEFWGRAEGDGIPKSQGRYRPAADGVARTRVYPDLGCRALVLEVGTPRTYERFTRRPQGAVGGIRQTLANSNQHALPHDIGVPGFFVAGDTTWPGLGTVACVLGSRLVAEMVLSGHRRQQPPSADPWRP